MNDGYSKGMPTMRVGRHHLPMGSVRQIVDKAYQKNRVLSIARLAFSRTNLLPDWQWEEKHTDKKKKLKTKNGHAAKVRFNHAKNRWF